MEKGKRLCFRFKKARNILLFKDMVAEINADAERMGVVMTFEEEVRHINRRWQNKLDEKEALLEQSVISLGKKDEQISELTQVNEELKKQIEALKAKA